MVFAACDEADAPVVGEASRSVAAVCERWLEVERGGDGASFGLAVPEVCDGVETEASEVSAALARLNASRWLAGVAEVGTLAAHQRLAEQVALMMGRNRSVAPVPERSWACYTEETGTAYRWTSHALGVTSVSQAVSLFVDAPDEATLANRMWMLDPVLDGVGLARVGDAAAVYVRGYVPRPAPAFVAYPGPGPFPATWLPRLWSFASTASLEGAEVVVTEALSGLEVPFSNYLAQRGGRGELGLASACAGGLDAAGRVPCLRHDGGRPLGLCRARRGLRSRDALAGALRGAVGRRPVGWLAALHRLLGRGVGVGTTGLVRSRAAVV